MEKSTIYGTQGLMASVSQEEYMDTGYMNENLPLIDRQEYIKTYCLIEPMKDETIGDYYNLFSKINHSYISSSRSKDFSEERLIDMLAKYGITYVEPCHQGHGVASVGFSPFLDKWYGWSHRGAFGFTVGSEVKKGDCAYYPSNKEDFEENELACWCGPDDGIVDGRIEHKDGKHFIVGRWAEDIPNEKLRGKPYIHEFEYPEVYGRGEWTAKTLEDAHKMAIDYANGVS